MTSNQGPALTIGKLARSAGVGVETVRYYQHRGLLPVPSRSGAYRYYPPTMGNRIRFIKRSQELGFSLNEIAELLSLEDGAERSAIRRVAAARLEQIRGKLTDLGRMESTLASLIEKCKHTTRKQPCPIILNLLDAPEQ